VISPPDAAALAPPDAAALAPPPADTLGVAAGELHAASRLGIADNPATPAIPPRI
jgi:hypothetical protein